MLKDQFTSPCRCPRTISPRIQHWLFVMCIAAKDFGGSKSHVFVLGPEDGQAKLADIAKQLSAEVVMQRLSLDNLTISYVDSFVQGKFDTSV